MATSRNDERSVTRTYRAAIRLGEDFITLEETITLPIDASDAEVQQAVELGWRIYAAQREAVERQVGGVREAQPQPAAITVRDPDSPASEKQRNYIAALQDDLSWTSEHLANYAQEQGVDLVTLNKGQASGFIDGLKKLAEERRSYGDSRPQAEPMSDRQYQALVKLAQGRNADLDGEAQRRYGLRAEQLSADQAREMIGEWQQRARNGRKELAL
jgi:hypothetical protein